MVIEGKYQSTLLDIDTDHLWLWVRAYRSPLSPLHCLFILLLLQRILTPPQHLSTTVFDNSSTLRV
jgi:hypothetical protein